MESVFKNNTASSSGGVMRVHKSVVVLRNCLFEGNFAEVDGGVIDGEVCHFVCQMTQWLVVKRSPKLTQFNMLWEEVEKLHGFQWLLNCN